MTHKHWILLLRLSQRRVTPRPGIHLLSHRHQSFWNLALTPACLSTLKIYSMYGKVGTWLYLIKYTHRYKYHITLQFNLSGDDDSFSMLRHLDVSDVTDSDAAQTARLATLSPDPLAMLLKSPVFLNSIMFLSFIFKNQKSQPEERHHSKSVEKYLIEIHRLF